MARTARKEASSGIYHVMQRGVGRQIIFEDDVDRRFYLTVLREELVAREGVLLAWCLMDNHVHLLVQIALDELSEVMRALGSAYALFFNRRHDRVGHLFQDRFMSEPVEDERYLLTVVRYIHQNPVRAGMSPTCDYRWSSYPAYMGARDESGQTSCDLVLSLFGTTDELVRFHKEFDYSGGCMDVGATGRPRSDEAARKIAVQALGKIRPEEVASLPRPRRNEAIRTLRATSLSLRQIERLTGVSRAVVSRVR